MTIVYKEESPLKEMSKIISTGEYRVHKHILSWKIFF